MCHIPDIFPEFNSTLNTKIDIQEVNESVVESILSKLSKEDAAILRRYIDQLKKAEQFALEYADEMQSLAPNYPD